MEEQKSSPNLEKIDPPVIVEDSVLKSINSTSTSSSRISEDKRRGVTKGTKRPIYFYCAAIQNGKLLGERIQARYENKARTIFEKKNSIPAQLADGPFYEVKDTSIATPDIDIDLTMVQYTKREWKGKYKGFPAHYRGISVQGFDPDELGLLVLGNAPEGSKLRRPRLSKPLVRRDALTDVEPA